MRNMHYTDDNNIQLTITHEEFALIEHALFITHTDDVTRATDDNTADDAETLRNEIIKTRRALQGKYEIPTNDHEATDQA